MEFASTGEAQTGMGTKQDKKWKDNKGKNGAPEFKKFQAVSKKFKKFQEMLAPGGSPDRGKTCVE